MVPLRSPAEDTRRALPPHCRPAPTRSQSSVHPRAPYAGGPKLRLRDAAESVTGSHGSPSRDDPARIGARATTSRPRGAPRRRRRERAPSFDSIGARQPDRSRREIGRYVNSVLGARDRDAPSVRKCSSQIRRSSANLCSPSRRVGPGSQRSRGWDPRPLPAYRIARSLPRPRCRRLGGLSR